MAAATPIKLLRLVITSGIMRYRFLCFSLHWNIDDDDDDDTNDNGDDDRPIETTLVVKLL